MEKYSRYSTLIELTAYAMDISAKALMAGVVVLTALRSSPDEFIHNFIPGKYEIIEEAKPLVEQLQAIDSQDTVLVGTIEDLVTENVGHFTINPGYIVTGHALFETQIDTEGQTVKSTSVIYKMSNPKTKDAYGSVTIGVMWEENNSTSLVNPSKLECKLSYGSNQQVVSRIIPITQKKLFREHDYSTKLQIFGEFQTGRAVNNQHLRKQHDKICWSLARSATNQYRSRTKSK